MKKITLLLLVLAATTSFAQQIYIEGGKTLASFDYKNSQGVRLDNLQATPHSFMTVGYRDQLFIKNLNISLGTSYAGYGAIGSDDTVGNYMEWDVNYLEFNTGLDYKLFKIKKAHVYIKGTASVAFLVQGTQTINNKVIDLKNQDDFDKNVFDFRAGVGFTHPISENLAFYVQYMRGKSLKLKDGTAVTDDQEELRYVSDNISFGLLINIAKK
ncbi:outer membrane beta-barrel protein [Lutibacter sp.]|uniref:outer membrane beta-barrel protein n=1 Tax=Lutibacter sp. TaxID=1925666 RepID=UPI0025C0F870|nr:outer membrane beta-barrel protein [Lutibacter sp.]MCF6167418.1 outer membrane beta-barrel protein [Lutibacter sp.]